MDELRSTALDLEINAKALRTLVNNTTKALDLGAAFEDNREDFEQRFQLMHELSREIVLGLESLEDTLNNA